MANTINTRIQLKNDTIENWDGSQLSLLQGEVALAKLSGDLSGKYEIRIGDGEKTFTGLGSNVVIPSENVIGLEDTVKSLSATHHTLTSKAALDALTGMNPGDTAVVKETIADDKISYTAYVFDGTENAWVAMDGNYDATNVYFKDNIIITQDVGNVKCSGGQGEIPAAGKNIAEVFQSLWTKECESMTVDRVVTTSFTITNATNNYEVGTAISTLTTAVDATFSVTDTGSWTYGSFDANGTKSDSNNTGITVSAALSNAIDGTVSSLSGMAKGGKITLSCGTYKNLLTADYVTDADITCTVVSGNWSHTASTTKPLTNLKNAISAGTVATDKITSIVSGPATTATYAAAKGEIDAKTTTSLGTKAITISGWRKMWIGGSTATGDVTEAEIKALRLKVGSKDYSNIKNEKITSLDVAVGAITGIKRFIIALPQGTRTLTSVLLKSASNTPITSTYQTGRKTMQITGANGVLAKDYDVYIYEPASIGSDEVHTITIS